jgi:rubrerythrin
LADDARRAVERALADERRAESIYAAIDRQLGPGTPFTRIVQAERRHASALETVLLAHGLPLPAAEAVASPSIGDRKSACALGVASERANIAMYDELLAGVLPPDVRCVFEHLRAASKERHQPAFERCDGR